MDAGGGGRRSLEEVGMVAAVSRVWGWPPGSRGRQDLRVNKSLVINASIYFNRIVLALLISVIVKVMMMGMIDSYFC